MKPIPNLRRTLAALLLTFAVLLSGVGCTASDSASTSAVAVTTASSPLSALEITNCERATLEIGAVYQLETNAPADLADELEWSASNGSATVDAAGKVTAISAGKVAITVRLGELSDSVLFEIVEPDAAPDTSEDPDVTVSPDVTDPPDPSDSPDTTDSPDPSDKPDTTDAPDTDDSATNDDPDSDELTISPERDRFYGDADPADSYEEALERSKNGQLSGALTVPDQAPTVSLYQPSVDGKLIRNSEPYFADSNTYVVVDAYGAEVFRVYRGGGYITLEEVAAYVYAFGDVPANYVSNKKTDPDESIWGEYLRLNHSAFSGSTSKYPYEPQLPRISGCGGDLYYYEIDIGTTGTDCDPGYDICIYNDGHTITRGAARIVYTRYDANRNNIIDPNEKFVFYTYNHYNDFQEYLGYYGGWGVLFGNITGGGTLSSKYDYNPTSYVESVLAPLPKQARVLSVFVWVPEKNFLWAAA
ncbi:MAG: Ig-like domain-containing protein [Clostridia bacterium]|nr:Ig-like domain-containing protein [Clostridia bacterium]